MKVLQESTTPQTSSSFNAGYAARAVFITISLLERQYAADYLDRILRGEDRFGFRNESHKQLETYGLLEKFWRSKLVLLFDVFVEDGYLEVVDQTYGNLGLTEKAKAFLETPGDILIDNKRLRTSPKDGILFKQLRMMRKQLSEEAGIMPYEVFTNFGMKGLVKHKPADIATLKDIAGISHAQADRYGQAILQHIQDVEANAWKLITVRKAHYPSSQEIKGLFLEGKSLAEITKIKGWVEESVIRIIETLHLAGEIDATAWIESHIDAKVLNKGITYFQQVEDARLKAAYETLDLDYRTLRMCRLYVSDVIRIEDELKIAA